MEQNKVLFLPTDQPNHAMDTLYRGICELLGNANVLDYPKVEKYHSEERNDPYGWWTYCNNLDAPAFEMKKLIEMMRTKEITHVIGNYYTLNHIHYILDNLATDTSKPIIYIIHENDSTARHDNYRRQWRLFGRYKKYVTILKVDLLRNHDFDDFTVRPLHMGCPPKIEQFITAGFEGQEKTYDVCLAMGSTTPYREIISWKLKDIKDLIIMNRYGNVFHTLEEYFRILNASKICISVRGAGWSTTRYVEVPTLKSMLLSERLPTIIPNDYTDGVNAVFFNPNLTDLEEKIKYYIEHEDERLKIATAGYEHAKQYLSTTGMARYVLGVA